MSEVIHVPPEEAFEEPNPNQKPEKPLDRLTVHHVVYFQSREGESKEDRNVFERLIVLKEDDQVFPYRYRVGEEWKPLVDKKCWVENCSMISIHNEMIRSPYNLTPEEIERNKEKILLLAFWDASGSGGNDGDEKQYWLIRPGESFTGSPSVFQNLRVRCKKGETRYYVHIYPGE